MRLCGCNKDTLTLTLDELLSFRDVRISSLVVGLCLFAPRLLCNLRKEHVLVVQKVKRVLKLCLQTIGRVFSLLGLTGLLHHVGPRALV